MKEWIFNAALISALYNGLILFVSIFLATSIGKKILGSSTGKLVSGLGIVLGVIFKPRKTAKVIGGIGKFIGCHVLGLAGSIFVMYLL